MADTSKPSATLEEKTKESKAEETKTGGVDSSQKLQTAAESNLGQSGSIASGVAIGTKTATAEFTKAFTSCMEQFGPLGAWIKQKVRAQFDKLSETLNIPKMYEKFKALSPLAQVAIVIGILGAMMIVQFVSWKLVSFIWTHLQEFIESEKGQALLASCTSFLMSMTGSNVVTKFTAIFATAADKSKAKSVEDAKDEKSDKVGKKKKDASDSEPSSSDDEKKEEKAKVKKDEDNAKDEKEDGKAKEETPKLKSADPECFSKEMGEDLKSDSGFSTVVVDILSGFFGSMSHLAKSSAK